MNISRFIVYYPYVFVWSLLKLIRKEKVIDFYCGNIVDYICIKKVLQHYPDMRIVAKNHKVQKSLKAMGVKATLYPTFPDIVIMCRHSARKYPGHKLKKIGLRHGPYHFKDFINARYYNEFDSYFFTSPTEVKQARALGIKNGEGVGYPKLDDAFDGTIGDRELLAVKKEMRLNNSRPTIIFTSTWNKTNYSAVNKWYNRLTELVDKYNVLVTVHDWTSIDVKKIIKETPGIFYLENKEVLPYLMIADLMIGDISSIIAEFCALNKPMITFRINEGKRTTSEIIDMLDKMSYRIDTFEELEPVIDEALHDRGLKHQKAREYYNKIMFGVLDGQANIRAKIIIDKYIKDLK